MEFDKFDVRYMDRSVVLTENHNVGSHKPYLGYYWSMGVLLLEKALCFMSPPHPSEQNNSSAFQGVSISPAMLRMATSGEL